MIRQVKTLIKLQFPFLVPLWRQVWCISLAGRSPKSVFSKIFREKGWGDKASLSGSGSNLAQTEAVRRILPILIKEINCRSLLDIPCGDFYWMKLVDMDIEYTGADIVNELIRNNQHQYGGSNKKFINLDLLQDKLPKVDLVLCRDCLVHLSNNHIYRALKNIKKSGSGYLLTTTFVGRERNENIPTGLWRPINLQISPFQFPKPMKLIDEECPLEEYRDKHLGLWRTDDIPDF